MSLKALRASTMDACLSPSHGAHRDSSTAILSRAPRRFSWSSASLMHCFARASFWTFNLLLLLLLLLLFVVVVVVVVFVVARNSGSGGGGWRWAAVAAAVVTQSSWGWRKQRQKA